MVGPGRLELPTPRLSSVCSNQLSYGPISLNDASAIRHPYRPEAVAGLPAPSQSASMSKRHAVRRVSAEPMVRYPLKKEKRSRRFSPYREPAMQCSGVFRLRS
jgi:hypothetical protein